MQWAPFSNDGTGLGIQRNQTALAPAAMVRRTASAAFMPRTMAIGGGREQAKPSGQLIVRRSRNLRQTSGLESRERRVV